MKLIARMAVTLALAAAMKVIMCSDDIIYDVRQKYAKRKWEKKEAFIAAINKMDEGELKKAIIFNNGKIVVDEKKEYKITVK